MSDLTSTTVAMIDGNRISLNDLLKDLHVAGQLRPIIARSIVDRTIEQALKTEGIQVTPQELQKASDRFRSANKLNKAEDTCRWLESRNMTVDDLEQTIRNRIGRQKLVAQVTHAKIEPFFSQNRERFDMALLSRIVVQDEGLATEIRSQIEDDDASFASLARQHSIDLSSKRAGGRTRPVRRKRLPAAIESAVFAAKEKDLLGPFQIGDKWVLVKVEGIRLGRLTRKTAFAIQRLLFRQWLRRKVAEAKPEVTLIEQLQS